ncbi:MAG: PilZ domain-containing protein [Rhodocyclaceae bacterium]|nr:PilZ domain-containing protein [Rhodocyclaceae bacterium]
MPESNAHRPPLLPLNLANKAQLYAAYMPFISNGGLFLKTARPVRLGEEVFLLLQLPGEAEKISIAGRVAWVSPPGCQGGKPAGIGVRFSSNEANAAVRSKIENLLAGQTESGRPTSTL